MADMSECSLNRQNLMIVHFLGKDEKALSVIQKDCQQRTLPFDEVYFPISSERNTNKIFMEKLIHVVNTLSAETCDSLILKLFDLNSGVIYFLQQLKPPANMFMYIEGDFILHSQGAINLLGLPYKMINIFYETRVQGTYEIQYNSVFQTFCLMASLIDKNSDILECKAWYLHFLHRGFQCSFGRLMQFSATCYLNSVLNGLFLSKWLRLLLLAKFHLEPPREYEPLDSLSCPTETTKTSKAFLMTLVYNLLVKKTKINKKGLDILHYASRQIYTQRHDMLGGIPHKTLVRILDDLNIPNFIEFQGFYLKFKNLYDDTSDMERVDTQPKDVDIITSFTGVDVDIRLYPYNHTTTIYFGDTLFELQCSIITYSLETITHAIVGFFCNNRPLIYDSESNMLLDFDWLNFDITILSNILHITIKSLNVLFIYLKRERIQSLLHKF